MGLNFIPSREQMSKEIDQCVERHRPEMLFSFCNCCIARSTGALFSQECRSCNVRKAIYTLSVRQTLHETHPELPGRPALT